MRHASCRLQLVAAPVAMYARMSCSLSWSKVTLVVDEKARTSGGCPEASESATQSVAGPGRAGPGVHQHAEACARVHGWDAAHTGVAVRLPAFPRRLHPKQHAVHARHRGARMRGAMAPRVTHH